MSVTIMQLSKYDEISDPDAVYMQAATENFPVATRFLPARTRRDLMAIYGFARLTDDIGDELDGDRTAALAWLEDELERTARARATHPVTRALEAPIREHSLPLQPFRDLIAANRQDQVVRRYDTFEDLVGYCRLSANPVGRLVLGVLELATPERIALSDDVCTGLQVVEHLQDVAEDFRVDRVYLPLEELRAEKLTESALGAPRADRALCRVVGVQAARARRLLFSGVALAASLPLRPRVAVAGFAAGGMAALDDIEAHGFDVLAHSCRPRRRRLAARLALVLLAAPSHPVPDLSRTSLADAEPA